MISGTEPSPNSSCLKNKGNFSFRISRQGGVITTDHYTFASNSRKIRIFLNGIIYNSKEEQLIDGFLSHGTDYINQLDGSFIIFLIEGSHFYILTDKVNSKKAYYAILDGIWYVSNNIDALPKHKCHISLDGLACYLANGVMLNDLTLFQEIKSAQRASVHDFYDGELLIQVYWNLQFEYTSCSDIQQQEYQKELELLLIDSIKRRYSSSPSTIAISLSGGYDSRSILGIFHKEIKASNISCFSYALTDNPEKDSDADLARKFAAQCGYPHQILESYLGDLIGQLEVNAREGKCVSDFCIELDVWHRLAEIYKFSDIFVGDECFGRDEIPSESKEGILDSIYIRGASGIKWLENFISKKIYKQMCESLEELTDDIFNKTKTFIDPHDKVDFLYIDQRINHALMPWRENFSSQAGFVHNPFLDGRILEFIKKLPPQMRKNKSLFKNTIKDTLPDLFSIKRATSKDFIPDWQDELRKNKDSFTSLIQGTDSRLDDIVSKKELLTALSQRIPVIKKVRSFPIKGLNYIRTRNDFAEKIIGFLIGTRVKQSVNPSILLIRLLLIRIYLSQSPS